ncbi:response regulator transcription factor [Pseudidiomarina sp. 1APP75-32.1]|uniref:Response regulator transcription factor n=2 Tax=Pseudidiomarina terrestris TaxID=2820060 RepID=A0AAW7R334_9GAMM|nr:response regulator transcription factor [Pseudidiomarina sp. 1APP75-32.1]MDN7129922.1 response regulator transcription factor [Pseudidiomarina sp. 1APR75-15]MDN7138387.1 response regulator transcription factor [Pseudidiomarina sp. 1ASP75-14]
MARAIIADDHPLFRAALRQALTETLDTPILEAASFEQLSELIHSEPQIELILLDLTMPGNRGLTGLTSLRSRYPDILVVIVSANEQVATIRQAMAFGASAYIPKSMPLAELQQAVHAVLAGDTWLPEHLRDAVEAELPTEHVDFAQRLEQLTPQQFRVLECLADGLLNKQIAFELNVQETTIKQHVSAILRKLNVINRTQAGIVFKQMLNSPDLNAATDV